MALVEKQQSNFTDMKSKVFLAYLIAALTLSVSCSKDYLRVSPDFLKVCQLNDAEFEKCFSTALQSLFTNWKDGAPGRTDIGAFDPFHIKRVRLAQTIENVADIQAELTNITAHGLSKSKVVKSSFDPKNYNFKIFAKMPKLHIDSNYKIKGRLLVLNLDDHGTMTSDLSDLDYFIAMKTQLKQVGDERFFDIVSLKSNIKAIGGYHQQLNNLFNGDPELGKTTNQLINENWRDFFQIMRPAITEAIDAIILDRFKKIFSYLPARFFVSDL